MFAEHDTYCFNEICLPTRGAVRTLLCDLHKQKGRLLQTALYDLLLKHERSSLSGLKKELGVDDWSIVLASIQSLINEGYLRCLVGEQDRVIPISTAWNHPSAITNAIVDVTLLATHDFGMIAQALSDLGCVAIQFRLLLNQTLLDVEEITAKCEGMLLRHLDFALTEYPGLSDDDLVSLCDSHPLISRITVFGSALRRRISLSGSPTIIDFVEETLKIEDCGQVSESLFSLNMHHVLESRLYNSCLNRKLSINSDGELCHCPSMKQTFGKPTLVNINDVVSDPTYTAIFNITKDEIEVCKDCEFRHICTDCRCFVQPGPIKHNICLGKPIRCRYDPYTAKWD
jgi:SPASM domain peptide maturase of grasp-with-spasm system